MTPDTSVLVAAFGTWHERHHDAPALVCAADALGAHVAVETCSVLSRLPMPQRAPLGLVVEFLDRHFGGPWLSLDGDACRDCLVRARAAGVAGGSLYDAIVAETARVHEQGLHTFDQRAVRTYSVLGVTYRMT